MALWMAPKSCSAFKNWCTIEGQGQYCIYQIRRPQLGCASQRKSVVIVVTKRRACSSAVQNLSKEVSRGLIHQGAPAVRLCKTCQRQSLEKSRGRGNTQIIDH